MNDKLTDREHIQSLLLLSPIVAVTCDSAMLVDWANDASRQLLGWSLYDLKGKKVEAFLVPEEHKQLHDGYVSAYRSTGIAKGLCLRVRYRRCRDGDTIEVSTRHSDRELRDPGGHDAVSLLKNLTFDRIPGYLFVGQNKSVNAMLVDAGHGHATQTKEG